MKVTPEFVVSFETQLKGLISSNWNRVASNLNWDRFMKVRPSSTKREILVWLLESARIYPEGDGGNTRYDDIAAATFSYENDNAGAGLRLTKNELEDNQMKDNPSVAALDYGRKWASDMGAAAAFYPQQMLYGLITTGKTNKGYDGVPFFSEVHPVNPNGGGGTYSNIIRAVPINASAGAGSEQDALIAAQRNLAKALAAVRAQRALNGIPRYLVGTTLLVPTALQYRAEQLTGGDMLSQTTNVLRNRRLEVVVEPQLDAEPDVYYIGVEDMLADDLGAFVWSEREAFFMREFGWMTQLDLAHKDMFEWLMKGRNTAVYGHPHLFYRCEPT